METNLLQVVYNVIVSLFDLPIRDGNTVTDLVQDQQCRLFDLPIRDGNWIETPTLFVKVASFLIFL